MSDTLFTKEDQQAMRETALAAIGEIKRPQSRSRGVASQARKSIPLFPDPGTKVDSIRPASTGMKWTAPSLVVLRKRTGKSGFLRKQIFATENVARDGKLLSVFVSKILCVIIMVIGIILVAFVLSLRFDLFNFSR